MKLKCNISNCRVEEFIIGDWELTEWEHEESSAWHSLRPIDCPGCGEEGEEQ